MAPFVQALADSATHCTVEADMTGVRRIVVALGRLRVRADHPNAMAVYALAGDALRKEAICALSPKDCSLTLNALARAAFKDGGALISHVMRELGQQTSLQDWTPIDVALLCNAVAKLRPLAGDDYVESNARWRGLLARVDDLLPELAPRCSAQDTAHLMAAFASLPVEDITLAQHACRKLLHCSPIVQHVDEVSPEGLCALLTSLSRVRLIGTESAPVFRAALRRISRGGVLQLSEPGHLSHLAHAFAAWLPATSGGDGGGCGSNGSGGSGSFRGAGGVAPTGAAALGRAEVLALFDSLLRPAIARAADRFIEPRHIVYAAGALARAGCRESAETEPLEMLASRLLAAQREPSGPLRWERFPDRAVAMLAESFAQLDVATGGDLSLGGLACDSPIVLMLDSFVRHLLQVRVIQHCNGGVEEGLQDQGDDSCAQAVSCAGPSGRLALLDVSSACRIARACCWTPRGVEVCRAALASVLLHPLGQLTAFDASHLLAAMARLELRDGKSVGELLWHLHWRLWWAGGNDVIPQTTPDGMPDSVLAKLRVNWDVRTAAGILSSLGRLGVFGEAARCDAVRWALACMVWATEVLLLDSGELVSSGSSRGTESGRTSMAEHVSSPDLSSLARSLGKLVEEAALSLVAAAGLAERLVHAVARPGSFEGRSRLQATAWCDLARALGRLASCRALPALCVMRLRGALHDLMMLGYSAGPPSCIDAASVLSALAIAGVDGEPTHGLIHLIAAAAVPDGPRMLSGHHAVIAFCALAALCDTRAYMQPTAARLVLTLAEVAEERLLCGGPRRASPMEMADVAVAALIFAGIVGNDCCHEVPRKCCALLSAALSHASEQVLFPFPACDTTSVPHDRVVVPPSQLSVALYGARFSLGAPGLCLEALRLQALRSAAALGPVLHPVGWPVSMKEGGEEDEEEQGAVRVGVAEALRHVDSDRLFLTITPSPSQGGVYQFAHR